MGLRSSVFCAWFFFFSSRRRHTRLQGDWSSDVCSSDLGGGVPQVRRGQDPRQLLTLAEVASGAIVAEARSEERRVGKEWRSRWWPDDKKKKKQQRKKEKEKENNKEKKKERERDKTKK